MPFGSYCMMHSTLLGSERRKADTGAAIQANTVANNSDITTMYCISLYPGQSDPSSLPALTASSLGCYPLLAVLQHVPTFIYSIKEAVMAGMSGTFVPPVTAALVNSAAYRGPI